MTQYEVAPRLIKVKTTLISIIKAISIVTRQQDIEVRILV